MSIRSLITAGLGRAATLTARALDAFVPKVTSCDGCPTPTACRDCPLPVEKRATLKHAEMLVTGEAVAEPKRAPRSTNASRRIAQARQDAGRTTEVPTPYGLNRAQRRALGLHKGVR